MGKSGSEILRLVEALHREKDIDKEIVFRGLEAALISAARKHFGTEKDINVQIDRHTGNVSASDEQGEIHPMELGRIAAQTAKQVIIQKIREAEREALQQEYTGKINSIASGSVLRLEGPNIIVNLGRTEGLVPRSEQIPGESYHIGERIRALITEVRGVGSKIRVVLSRTRPELVTRLFELEVPEVSDHVVEIKAIAREAGYRSKVAVSSTDARVDCVGACVGVQGSRIRNIVDELNGEKIDIVRWSEAPDTLIAQALKPAEIVSIQLDPATRHAQVTVPRDQQSLAIGKRGQNVWLACKLTGWEIDIRAHGEPLAPTAGTAAAPTEPAEEPAQAAPGEAPGANAAANTTETESRTEGASEGETAPGASRDGGTAGENPV